MLCGQVHQRADRTGVRRHPHARVGLERFYAHARLAARMDWVCA